MVKVLNVRFPIMPAITAPPTYLLPTFYAYRAATSCRRYANAAPLRCATYFTPLRRCGITATRLVRDCYF